MTRHFSLLTTLRMTPNPILREFFRKLGHEQLHLRWNGMSERNIEPLTSRLQDLPRGDQDAIEAALHSVFELACASGVSALLEASVDDEDPQLSVLRDEHNAYEKAMWAWLNRPDLFDRAAMIHQVDNLSRWHKRKNLPQVEPDISEAAILDLQSSLSEMLRRQQGRGRRCTIEHFRRSDQADYFYAYPDDFMHTVMMHDEQGNLTPRSVRQTFEIVFAYCRESGTLELFAKLPQDLKVHLEWLFCRAILRIWPTTSRYRIAYNLKPLLRGILATDPEDHISVHIRKLRLAMPEGDRYIVLETGQGDLHQMLGECLNTQRVPLTEVDVLSARLCFEFQPPYGRKSGGSMTFDVAYPDSCSLRNQHPERIRLAQKYLKQWGIAVV